MTRKVVYTIIWTHHNNTKPPISLDESADSVFLLQKHNVVKRYH